MSIKIEEAYNDCFERMISGETLESCLSSYPEYAAELDTMLRVTYDVKRKAYPIQPRPEFKYWARVRLQNAQYYGTPAQKETSHAPVSFNLRRNLAISLSALLVLVIASSGTVAASSDAMPDEPLYGVKLAVEQAQVTLAPSDADKAEIYARLAEKRAQEISVMAIKGNDAKVVSTTNILNSQLRQLEANLAKMEEEAASTETAATVATVAAPSPAVKTARSLPPVPSVPGAPATAVTVVNTIDNSALDEGSKQDSSSTGSGQSQQSSKRIASIIKARDEANSSTAKTLTILQNALNKAPASVKSSLNNAINQTITTNKRIQTETTGTIKRGTQGSGTNVNNDEDDTSTDTNTKPNVNRNNRLKNKNTLNNK